MPARIIKLVIPLILFVALFSFLFLHNPNPVIVNYGGDKPWEAPLAIVLAVVFSLGATVSALVAFLFAVKQSFLTWRGTQREKQLEKNKELITRAREFQASDSYSQATVLFRQIIEHDSTNVAAWVALAEIASAEGKLSQALKIVEQARLQNRTNLELLFLASNINAALGNKTAALNDLLLIFQLDPQNRKTLKMLVSLCSELSRFDEALNYQEQLLRLLSGVEHENEQYLLAALRYEKAKSFSNAAERYAALEDTLRKHRDYPPAIRELAQLEVDRGNLKAGAKLLTRGFVASCDPQYLEDLSILWLEAQNPEAATGAVTHALLQAAANGPVPDQAHLVLIELYFHLEMIHAAKEEMEKLLSRKPDSESSRLGRALAQARLLIREDRLHDALTLLIEAISTRYDPPKFVRATATNGSDHESPQLSPSARTSYRQQPSPRFSTP